MAKGRQAGRVSEKTGTATAGATAGGGHVALRVSPKQLTPNEVVAYNLHRARNMRGWTQEQAAERLEPFLGKRWSKASFSAAERSVTSDRAREFTVDELVAFARCFDLPPRWFMTLPPETRE